MKKLLIILAGMFITQCVFAIDCEDGYTAHKIEWFKKNTTTRTFYSEEDNSVSVIMHMPDIIPEYGVGVSTADFSSTEWEFIGDLSTYKQYEGSLAYHPSITGNRLDDNIIYGKVVTNHLRSLKDKFTITLEDIYTVEYYLARERALQEQADIFNQIPHTIKFGGKDLVDIYSIGWNINRMYQETKFGQVATKFLNNRGMEVGGTRMGINYNPYVIITPRVL